MLNRKKLITSLSLLIGVYLVLVIPMFGGSETYADFYRSKADYFFNEMKDNGYVVFEAHNDNGNDDTRVYIANKSQLQANGDLTSFPFNISTRILAYLPTILLIALCIATPIKIWKRAVMLIVGFIVLQALLMFFLYIMLLNKFITTSWLNMYQNMGSTKKAIIHSMDASINHGMGLNNFLVVLIWFFLVFIFDRKVLDHLVKPKMN